jgi:hypothetical protein
MLSKQKLKKIEAILESYLPLLEKQENGRHNTSTVSLVYASGLNLLIKKGEFEQITNKKNRIKNAKMVRAAKNLVIQFEDFGITSYADLSDNILDNIRDINGKSKLAPLQDSIKTCIQNKLNDYELECDAFYTSLLVDIFNQGRMHQTVANPNSQSGFKKFASFDLRESQGFDSITANIKNELMIYIDYLKQEIALSVDNCYKQGFSKSEILIHLAKEFSKYSIDMQEIFRKHSWQVYSFGNLYQLEKDKVKHIAWKTGHHIDDCLTCRAFQTGEAILKNEDGQELPHVASADAVIYNLQDVLKIAKWEGPRFFCHDDCRCQFIAAN